MLLGTSLTFLERVPLVRAQVTGEVCLTEIASTACPAMGPVFNGPLSVPVTQLRVAVFIQGSDSLNGFDITLKSDHNTLKPAETDLTGTVLPGSVSIILDCVGGVNRTRSPCSSTDSADTLRLAAVGLGLATPSPTTGLLFTATYNITQTTASGVAIGFQTGCATSSVAGTSSVCVTISNGTVTPDSETVQSADFNNAAPPPWISISSSASMIGILAPGVSETATITTSGQNGWPGFSTDSIAFTHRETPGLSVVFPTSCGTSATCSAILGLSSMSEGAYTVTVFGEYSAYDPTESVNDHLVATVTVKIQVQAFTISISPANMSFASGSSISTTVNVGFGSGFAGTVLLATTLLPASGLTVSCSSSSVAASSPSSTCTFRSSTPGNYNVTITGTSGPFSHSANATVKVLSIVQPPTSPSGIFGLQPLQFLGIVVGVVVAGGLVFLFFRRRKLRPV